MKIEKVPAAKTEQLQHPLLPIARALAKAPGETLRISELPAKYTAIRKDLLAKELEAVLGERWTVTAEYGDKARTPQSYLVTATYYDAKAAGIPGGN